MVSSLRVSFERSDSWAKPKSMMVTCCFEREPLIIKLLGLMSRWTMPFS